MTTELMFSVNQPGSSDEGDENAVPEKLLTDDERERRRIEQRIKELDDEYETMKTHNAYLRWKASKNGNILKEKGNSVKVDKDETYDHVYCNDCCFFFSAAQYTDHQKLHIAVDRMIQTQNSEREEDSSPELSRRARSRRVVRPKRQWDRNSPY